MKREWIGIGELREQIENALAERQRRTIKQRNRPSGATFGCLGRHSDFGFISTRAGCLGDRTDYVTCGQRPQQQPPASGSDGRQFATGGMTDKKQQRVLRWFFQNLQQGIGPFALKVVNRIDDGNPPSALACG